MSAPVGRPTKRTLSLIPLVFATYFMASGGPYGLEEVIARAGYGGSALILLGVALAWSLPVVLMLGELGSMMPEEGGYVVWVTRALGPFWGVQEAVLSLVASVLDMAIYPTLFVLYITRLFPSLAPHGFALGAALIAIGTLINLLGIRAVGGISVVLGIAVLLPFLLLFVLALREAPPVQAAPAPHWVGAMAIAMWNLMGWDNASTVLGEIREPTRTYPRAMLGALALTVVTYVAPILAISRLGIEASRWNTGFWVEAGAAAGGPRLSVAIALGGALSGAAMFASLLLSYSRVPLVLAANGYLPRVLLRENKTGTAWLSVLLCSGLYMLCLGLGFERLVLLDVLIYGSALMLEFVALVVLRVREPLAERPFRIKGGTLALGLLGLGPLAMLLLAFRDALEDATWVSPLVFAGALLAGPVLHLARRRYGKSTGMSS